MLGSLLNIEAAHSSSVSAEADTNAGTSDRVSNKREDKVQGCSCNSCVSVAAAAAAGGQVWDAGAALVCVTLPLLTAAEMLACIRRQKSEMYLRQAWVPPPKPQLAFMMYMRLPHLPKPDLLTSFHPDSNTQHNNTSSANDPQTTHIAVASTSSAAPVVHVFTARWISTDNSTTASTAAANDQSLNSDRVDIEAGVQLSLLRTVVLEGATGSTSDHSRSHAPTQASSQRLRGQAIESRGEAGALEQAVCVCLCAEKQM